MGSLSSDGTIQATTEKDTMGDLDRFFLDETKIGEVSNIPGILYTTYINSVAIVIKISNRSASSTAFSCFGSGFLPSLYGQHFAMSLIVSYVRKVSS